MTASPMQTPAFFDQVPSIVLYDALAQTLGAVQDGLIEYRYLDAVKLAGHSCPTVAGAWLMARAALARLYPIPLHTTHSCARAKRTPSTNTAISRSPSHSVLAPGSPSPFLHRKPPNLAISRTTALSCGAVFGTGFLFKM